MAGQVILSVAYGVDVLPEGDPSVEDAENVLQAMAFGSTKQALMFDMIPWCMYRSLLSTEQMFTRPTTAQ